MSQQQSLRRRRQYRPRLETLEDRTVPTTTVGVAGNTLFIFGDATSQTILVLDNGGNGNNAVTAPTGSFNSPNYTAAPTSITVIAGGVARTFNQDIRNVIINTGTSNASGKSDFVVYDFTQGLQAGGRRNISTSLGGLRGLFGMVFGSTFNATSGMIQGGIGNDANLALTVTGTNHSSLSKDTEILNATNDFAVGARASFYASLNGGPGNDRIGMDVAAVSVSPGSNMTLLANGGPGSDRVFEDVMVGDVTTLQTGPTAYTVGGGTVNLQAEGGSGDDLVGLTLNTPSAADQAAESQSLNSMLFTVTQSPLKVNAVADGGSGHNIGVVTPGNVTVMNLQDLTLI